jgi:hypothetical protein
MSCEFCGKCLCLSALRLDCESREIKELIPNYVAVFVLHTVKLLVRKYSFFLGGGEIYSKISFCYCQFLMFRPYVYKTYKEKKVSVIAVCVSACYDHFTSDQSVHRF